MDSSIVDAGRQARLKEIIRKLHGGAAVAEVKKDFAGLIKGTSAAEVAAMEQALIDEGFPVEEIQRLCEVHVEVFHAALERGGVFSGKMPGHPVHSMIAENREAKAKARRLLRAARALVWGRGWNSAADAAKEALVDLSLILVHYARKENQLFPYLERGGFTGPSKVMWGKHDEIRAAFKDAETRLAAGPAAGGRGAARAFRSSARALAAAIGRMIFMEERILIPNALAKLSERDWALIRAGEEAIGFAWIAPGADYDAGIVLARMGVGTGSGQDSGAAAPGAGARETPLGLNTGYIGAGLLDLALKRLPIDVSVIDADDKVAYYSDSPERLFPRSPGAIGRDVRNCHPQKSVATVERILDAFKRKEKDSARFWIRMGGRFVVIEYRALYDESGEYRGTLEVSQDASDLRALEGERRLLDWEG